MRSYAGPSLHALTSPEARKECYHQTQYDLMANWEAHSCVQEYPTLPPTLPDWLIPSSKAHLVAASRALGGTQPQFERPQDYPDDDDTPGLKDGFDWYMSPPDRAKYTEIYTANASSPRGDVTFGSLEPLYASLDVPDTDIRSAWNLVNPRSEASIGKDACLAFLHILNNRHEGYRIPRSVPPSLRVSFERNTVDYNVERTSSPAQRWGSSGSGGPTEETSTGRKAKFGDTYLSRLGLGGKSTYRPSGTDFSSAGAGAGGPTTPDWEEVRLKKQLAELVSKIDSIEARAEEKRQRTGAGGRDSKPALVKRELEQMLEYKRRELRELERGEGQVKVGEGLKALGEEVASVREQVEGLDAHLRAREQVLETLRREIDAEKR